MQDALVAIGENWAFPYFTKRTWQTIPPSKKSTKSGKNPLPPPFPTQATYEKFHPETQVFDPETPGVHGQLQLLRKLQLCFKALHLLSSDHRLVRKAVRRVVIHGDLYQCIKVSPKWLYYMDIDGHIIKTTYKKTWQIFEQDCFVLKAIALDSKQD